MVVLLNGLNLKYTGASIYICRCGGCNGGLQGEQGGGEGEDSRPYKGVRKDSKEKRPES